MLWIGITGGIGTGKSTFSKILRQRSCVVLDADEISKALSVKGGLAYDEIVQLFGPEILDESGDINRKKIGEIVFTDPGKLKKLEKILHPKIKKTVENEKLILTQRGTDIAFYDVPLLYENNLQNTFDKVVVVYCDFEKQVARAIKRMGLSEQEIVNRINNQIFLDEKVKQSDFSIDNNGSLEDLEIHTNKFLENLNYQAQESPK